jgi:hypothetical protein
MSWLLARISPDNFKVFLSIIGMVPFLIVVNRSGGDKGAPEDRKELTIKMNWPRIVEALLIACVTAGVSTYMLVHRLEVKFNYLEVNQAALTKKVEEIAVVSLDNQKRLKYHEAYTNGNFNSIRTIHSEE